MRFWYVCGVIAAVGTATPLPQTLQNTLDNSYKGSRVLLPCLKCPENHENRFVLPMYDSEPLRRVDEIMKKQNGYLYGPSLIGNSSYFPTGILGNAMVQQDQDQWYTDAYSLTSHVVEEMQLAADALRKVNTSSRLNMHY